MCECVRRVESGGAEWACACAFRVCVEVCVCVVYAHSQVGHYILLDLSIDERMDVPRS